MKPKFRAWTEEGKVMYYDVYPFKNDTLLLSYDEIAFDEVPASDFILMQSTGLKDIYGKDVYEGDILITPFPRNSLLVVYLDTTAGVYLKSMLSGNINFIDDLDSLEELEEVKAELSKSIEIKGNIYENPELPGE